MLNGMAGENTIELGEVGDGAFCRKDLISWVFTPVLGSWSRGDAIFSFAARAHFCRAVIMWGGSIRGNEFIFWLVCLEVAISLCVMRPTSSDASYLLFV